MKLHVVDGTYELFRAHYAKRPDRPNKAVIGLVESLLALAADPEEQLTHVAVAFDNPIRCFRNDLYAGYKTEEGVEPALLAQFDGAEAATRAIGMVVWSMDRFEADDAMATAAARFADRVEQVRLLTPDKDLGQCISGQRVVQVDRMRRRVIDEDALVKLRGVPPRCIADWLALRGDDADGVPGLPGFGDKTAATLLSRFGRIEDIPEDVSRWPTSIRGPERLRDTLVARREDALLYRRLTELRRDVPLEEPLEALAWRGVSDGFDAWCVALEVPHLRRRAVAAGA